MRIYEPNRPGMIHSYQKANASHSAKGVKRSWGRDEVSISTEALEMLKRGEDTEIDPARQEKLDELKRKIEQGIYHVPAEKIAEKLLAYWKKPLL